MNWKSTAAVSGAGLLATWLAGYPSPATTPVATTAARPTRAAQAQPTVQATSSSSEAALEIQQLAEQLERRNRADDTFHRPTRNLFRFEPRVVALPPAAVAARAVIDVPTAPTPPPFHLSGIAMDRVEDREIWTAILSTPTGVVLARQGEQVAAGTTVTAIGAESVTLTNPDGSTSVLPLSGK